jgi:hypothetical protein
VDPVWHPYRKTRDLSPLKTVKHPTSKKATSTEGTMTGKKKPMRQKGKLK